jgi:hypothetical protein
MLPALYFFYLPSLAAEIFLIPSTGYPPDSTSFNCMSSISSSFYVFGGTSSSVYSNSLYIFSLDSLLWSQTTPSSQSQPAARINSVCFAYNSSFYVFAGQISQGFTNDLWKWEPGSSAWTEISQFGAQPSARTEMAFTVQGSFLYIFGGITDDGDDSGLFV